MKLEKATFHIDHHADCGVTITIKHGGTPVSIDLRAWERRQLATMLLDPTFQSVERPQKSSTEAEI